MAKFFNRKIFTFKQFFIDLGFSIYKIPASIAMSRNKKISKKFREKIMTVVTAVNGCTYCAWFHGKRAVSNGISKKEIRNMLDLQFKTNSSEYELLGLLYAQHYAESNRKTDREMEQKLLEFYGKKTADHIRLIIRMITFGNLSGNTFDAFLSRFKGQKAPNSNILFEAFFFIVSAPFLLPIMPFASKKKRAH